MSTIPAPHIITVTEIHGHLRSIAPAYGLAVTRAHAVAVAGIADPLADAHDVYAALRTAETTVTTGENLTPLETFSAQPYTAGLARMYANAATPLAGSEDGKCDPHTILNAISFATIAIEGWDK